MQAINWRSLCQGGGRLSKTDNSAPWFCTNGFLRKGKHELSLHPIDREGTEGGGLTDGPSNQPVALQLVGNYAGSCSLAGELQVVI